LYWMTVSAPTERAQPRVDPVRRNVLVLDGAIAALIGEHGHRPGVQMPDGVRKRRRIRDRARHLDARNRMQQRAQAQIGDHRRIVHVLVVVGGDHDLHALRREGGDAILERRRGIEAAHRMDVEVGRERVRAFSTRLSRNVASLVPPAVTVTEWRAIPYSGPSRRPHVVGAGRSGSPRCRWSCRRCCPARARRPPGRARCRRTFRRARPSPLSRTVTRDRPEAAARGTRTAAAVSPWMTSLAGSAGFPFRFSCTVKRRRPRAERSGMSRVVLPHPTVTGEDDDVVTLGRRHAHL
jgi:hypothetical protein